VKLALDALWKVTGTSSCSPNKLPSSWRLCSGLLELALELADCAADARGSAGQPAQLAQRAH